MADDVKAVYGELQTDRLDGPFVNPAAVLKLLQMAVDRDPGTEKKLMLFYLETGERLELVEAYSEARVCSMTFRLLGATTH